MPFRRRNRCAGTRPLARRAPADRPRLPQHRASPARRSDGSSGRTLRRREETYLVRSVHHPTAGYFRSVQRSGGKRSAQRSSRWLIAGATAGASAGATAICPPAGAAGRAGQRCQRDTGMSIVDSLRRHTPHPQDAGGRSGGRYLTPLPARRARAARTPPVAALPPRGPPPRSPGHSGRSITPL